MTAGVEPSSRESRAWRLEGQVAIVSGASSGLGRAIARRLADEGASVVCGDLQAGPVPGGLDGAEPTHETIASAGGQATFVEWNIVEGTETERALDLARDRYGGLDIVVANAGVGIAGPALPSEEAESWHRHLDVNLTGTWNTVRLGMERLIELGEGGRIVAISSIAGLVGLPGAPSGYGVTKAGIAQLARQAAVDGAPHGITANAVCAGYVRTAINRVAWEDPDALANLASLHPLGRMGEASDVAGSVAFLASPDASWITGIALTVDGGMTCA